MAHPTTVEAYLAAVPPAPRKALQKLRKSIKAAAPQATEAIAYRMPAFRVEGRFLVSYAAFKDHCSLFPATQGVVEACGDQVGPFLSGKGTLRFTVDKPIPDSLVKKIVKARIKENAAQRR